MNTIFYSWQADRDKTTCRNLIEKALREAIRQIAADASFEEADRPEENDIGSGVTIELASSDNTNNLALDKDTLGVPGSPPIVETIFNKIRDAALFVPDMTFVALRPDDRPSSNPNVLIEYGWALSCLTHARIIPVMNSAYGCADAKSLPFDMIHLRYPIQFYCAPLATETERRAAREGLTRDLKTALKSALAALPVQNAGAKPEFVSKFSKEMSTFRPEASIGILHDSLSILRRTETQAVWLEEGPSMWVRLSPQFDTGGLLGSRAIQVAITEQGRYVAPLNQRDPTTDIFLLRGEDGFGTCIGMNLDPSNTSKMMTRNLLYAFDVGEVWSIDKTYMLADTEKVHMDRDSFSSGLVDCATLLQRVGISGPYRWIAGIEGTRGRKLAETEGPLGGGILINRIIESGEFSGDPKDAASALSPFFAAVRRAAHLSP